MKLVHTGRELPDDVWQRAGDLTEEERRLVKAEMLMRRKYFLPQIKRLKKLLLGEVGA